MANLTRLVVLWLLSEGSLHGYQITRTLRDPDLRLWFPIEEASIYSVLRFLERRGYALAMRVEREGKRPLRRRYAITPEGRRYFASLLRDAWRAPARIGQPIDVALSSLPELDPDEIRALADERRRALKASAGRLAAARRAAPSPELVHRAHAIVAAEIRWLDGFIGRLGKGRADGATSGSVPAGRHLGATRSVRRAPSDETGSRR